MQKLMKFDSVQTGKTTNITVQAPSASAATPAPPATPGPGAPATTTNLANDIPDDTGAPSGFQYEEDDNSLVILNPKGDIVYIKIAESKTLKKILFSKTDNNQGSFKAFNFTNTSGELSFKQFKTDFFQGNTFVYNQMFGSKLNYPDIYNHLKSAALRCTVRGLFAMQCAAMHGMRSAGRCAVKWLRCNALRADWLHSRGAGGAMLFIYAIEGFLGWGFFGFG
jgi:hypothetical protein